MRKNLIIIDDFLENANQLREVGLSLRFPDLPGYFPGRNSVERISIEGLTDIIEGITGEALQPVVQDFSHGKFRIALSGDAGAGDIHFDFSATWSGVLFLTRPEDCQGGTAFFRHRASGTEQAPSTLVELQAMGYSSYDQLIQQIVREDGIDRAKWDMQFNVPMRFNRLVLFNSWLWHTAGPSFGNQLENGRLVYLMFFAPRQN